MTGASISDYPLYYVVFDDGTAYVRFNTGRKEPAKYLTDDEIQAGAEIVLLNGETLMRPRLEVYYGFDPKD